MVGRLANMTRPWVTHALAGGWLLIPLLPLSYFLAPYAFDDSYIHFRIARNMAELGVPYFNVDERVMSTSSPLWTAILSMGAALRIPLTIFVSTLNPVFLLVGASVWSRLLRLSTGRSTLIERAFFIGYLGILIQASFGLMETPLAMLLLGLAFASAQAGGRLAMPIWVMSVFTRPELLVFGPGVLWLLGSSKVTPISGHILSGFAVAAPLALVNYYFFRTFEPQTVVAKEAVYDLSHMQTASAAIKSLFPEWFLDVLLEFFPIPLLLLLASLLLASYVRALTWYTNSVRREILLFSAVFICGVVVLAAYVYKRVFLHEWYVPLFAVPLLFSVFGAVLVFRAIPIVLVAAMLLVSPVMVLAQYSVSVFRPDLTPHGPNGARVQRYLEVGKVLGDHFPGARLMTSEIGGLGFSFEGTILDGVGLVSPKAVEFHPMTVGIQRSHPGIGAIPADYVEAEKPELVVSYPIFVEEFDRSEMSRSEYRKVVIPAFSDRLSKRLGSKGIWGSDSLYIYIRRDVLVSRSLTAEAIRQLFQES